MALAANMHWEIRSTATTGNTGGAGFNPANANFLTDLTTDTNTGNTASPVVSSASYNFAAGDVNAWLYVSAGTNWTVGWYQIVSVASNKATLSAAIGAAVIPDTMFLKPSTVIGVATVGTPTGGTFGIDYSQQDAAQATATDYSAVGASTTLTSASGGFTRMMVGNIFHQTTTGVGGFGTVGWYEIVSYTNATTVVLDRAPNGGTASVSTTGFIGGAGRLNALEDAFFEMIQAGSSVWVKTGSYTISGTVSISSTNSTDANPSYVIGFTSLRGDTCVGSNKPVLACAANAVTFGQNQNFINITFTTTATAGVSFAADVMILSCKMQQSSASVRPGLNNANAGFSVINSEITSLNGTGIVSVARTRVIGCYIHDCSTGVSNTQQFNVFEGNIFEACDVAAITLTNNTNVITNNTIYGREGKIGIGINFNLNPNPNNTVVNNILYGLTTGISVATTAQKSNTAYYADYYNNTSDTSNLSKWPGSLAVDPQFTGASQITGTTATTAASVLTQAGGDFSTVSDNVDVLHVISGTGVTTGRYLITSHTGTTLTVNNALGTSSGGDVVYFVTVGHNFSIGTNLKALGFPTFTNTGAECTGYMDMGAVQRQEVASATAHTFS